MVVCHREICTRNRPVSEAKFPVDDSFPNFVERSILNLPLSKLWAMPLSTEQSTSRGGKKGERCREKGRKRSGNDYK